MKKILLLFIVFSFFLGACEDKDYPYVDLNDRQDIAISPSKPALTYAYLPQYSHTVSFERHHLLVKYLSAVTGLPIRQVFPDSFADHIKMVGNGKLDISYSNPFVYVKIAKRYKAQAIARVIENTGTPYFRGQIICRKDNKAINSVSDLKGKSWIAVDPSSAGGYLFVLGYLLNHGLKLSDFSEVSFARGSGGKQEQVVMAVYLGKYDFGSIREGTLDVVKKEIDVSQIRVLANTQWYPGWVFAVRSGLSKNVKEKIQQALLRLDIAKPDYRKILEAAGFKKVILATDKDYDPIRNLCKKLNINLDE